MSGNLVIKQYEGLESIPAAEWNALSDGGNPFVSHEYLYGLERHHCLDDHGWIPAHLVACEDARAVGAMPLYLRTNSFGEFVFDWAWADAFERAGGHYYPKLVSAIPFAPVIGPRLLVRDDCSNAESVRDALVAKAVELVRATGMSSFHCLFTANQDSASFRRQQLLQRLTCQFYWHNRGYHDFGEFLDGLTSKRRKQIRSERRRVSDNRMDIEVLKGGEISEEQWRIFYDFYCSTFYRRWGSPRLTLEFFHSLSDTMPDRVLLILARHEGRYVAGSFSIVGDNTVFGRHWGCSEQFPFLHFELCYYQTIEYCIRNELGGVDAGVQGEHKLMRGFEPVAARSFHWIQHDGFREAVDDFLERETREMRWYIENLSSHSPFKSTD